METTTASLTLIKELAIKLINTTWTIKFEGEYGTNFKREVNIGDLGYSFKFDNARRRFGCCNYTYEIISLSKGLCEKNLDNPELIEDTIRHEIAHAICLAVHGRDAKGHGSEWKAICVQVGANPIRCYDGDAVESVDSKYTATCPECDMKYPIHKLGKRFKNGLRSKACGKCCRANGGGYQERFKLIITQNY
jgi:predicted SprT family Zn-dependent metalloprotease